MNPIAQSQFVPLAEVVCCAVSDMNAAQTVVTQESLLEHLMRHYPGIAVPSQDILYSTLGTLIKERKIYHTGEGYFIVTPQTYFITTATPQETQRVFQSDQSRPGPTSVTYLVSVGRCAESAGEDAAPALHCQSCQCFPDVRAQDAEEPPPAAEGTRQAQKGPGPSRPSVQHRAVSVSEGNRVWESTRPLPYSKDKGKGRKFGLSLLWRSISRREKAKTEHSSFSAQFPPEEWPVRDEDNLDNIPRDVEHEIIKRINPVLTVDNIIKHTVLMRNYEEEKKFHSQGTSTDMLTARHKYPSKERVRKRQGRSAKPRRRGHSHRDRHKARHQGSELQPANRLDPRRELPAAQHTPRIKSPSEAAVQTPLGEEPTVLGSHWIYKRRISNPFRGLSLRGSPATRGHNAEKTSDLKLSPPLQRSQSWDSLGTFDGDAKRPCAGHYNDKPMGEPIHMNNSFAKPIRDAYRDPLLHYPQCSVLQRDTSKCGSLRESRLRCDVYGEEDEVIPEVFRNGHAHFDKLGKTKDTQHLLLSQSSSSLDQTPTACRLVDKAIHQFQNLGLLDYPVGANHLGQPERQDRDSEELARKAFVQDAEAEGLDDEGLSADGQALYPDEVEGEDGACSSLYLEDDDFSENDASCEVLPGHVPYSFAGESMWNHLGRQKVTERSPSEYSSKMSSFEPQMPKRNEDCKPVGLLINPGESQKPNVSAETCGLNSGTRFGFNYEGDPRVADCVQPPAPADGSVFDYCSARKPFSKAETVRDSAGDTGEKTAGWSQSPQNQEMRNHSKQKTELFSASHMPVLAEDVQHEHSHLEGTETHSMAGDSGIDSPRTQSLASNNSVVLDGLKSRQNFLQNFEGTKSSQTLTSNSLPQLTAVINV